MKKTRFLSITMLAIMSIVMFASCNDNKPTPSNKVVIGDNKPMAIHKAYAMYEADTEEMRLSSIPYSNTINEEGGEYGHQLVITTTDLEAILQSAIEKPTETDKTTFPANSAILFINVFCSTPNAFEYTDYTYLNSFYGTGMFYGVFNYFAQPTTFASFMQTAELGSEMIVSGTLSIKDANGVPEITLNGRTSNGDNIEMHYKGQLADGKTLMSLISSIPEEI